MADIWNGITIGGAGGAIAGLTVALVHYIHRKIVECIEQRRVYNWLKANTKDEEGKRYR